MDKKFFFTVEYPGAETKKGPVLYVPEGEISLYFLRFSLFFENTDCLYDEYQNATIYEYVTKYVPIDETGEQEEQLDDVELIRKEGLPLHFEKFDLVRTGLNQGYLYLINDDPEAEDAFRELEVNQSGFLSYIIEKGKRNVRYDDVRPEIDIRDDRQNVVVPKNSKYWIAYSMIQWDYNYLKEMLSNAEKRKERMQLVECNGIDTAQDNLANDIKSYKYVKAAFPVGDNRIYLFEKELKRIAAYYKSPKESENQLLGEMFITLNDPMGCAFDMGIKLREEHTLHYDLIEFLQTGKPKENVFKHFWKDITYSPNSNESNQFQALFGTALSLYHFLYGDPPKPKTPENDDEKEAREKQQEYMDDLREETSREKIEKVLGIKERKQQRQKIELIRNEFIKYLNCDYFCHFLERFMGNSYQIYLGKYYLSDLVNAIAVHPHYKDRFIDLPKDYEGDNDPKGDDFFERITQENNIYHKIFMAEVTEKDLVKHETFLQTCLKVDVEITFLRTIESIAEGFAMHCHKKSDMTPILDYITSLALGKEYTDPIRRSKPNYFSPAYPFIHKGKHPFEEMGGMEKKYVHIGYAPEEIGPLSRNTPLPPQEEPIPEPPATDPTPKKDTLVNRILNHPRFRAFILSLETLYVLVNLKRLKKDFNAKNFAYSLGAGVQWGYSYSKYREAKKLAMGLSKEEIGLTKTINRLSIYSQGIAIAMCFWESWDAFKERDTDAGLAWVVSGVLTGIALLKPLELTFILPFVGTLWGFALVVALSLGAMILAFYLTDDALERFVKNNLLSSEPAFKRRYYYMTYVEELIERRKELVTGVEEWQDLNRAQDDLYDILFAPYIKCNFAQSTPLNEKEDRRNIPVYERDSLRENTYKKLILTISPAQVIYDVSYFYYQLWFFPKGIKETYNTNTQPILVPIEEKNICLEENGKTTAFSIECDIYEGLFKTLYSSSSLFVFIYQAEIEPSNFYPIQRGGKRYYAMIINPYHYSGGRALSAAGANLGKCFEDFAQGRTCIGSFKEIINPNTWKK